MRADFKRARDFVLYYITDLALFWNTRFWFTKKTYSAPRRT